MSVFALRHPLFVVGCALALLLFAARASAQSEAIPDTLSQRIAACSTCHGLHGEGAGNGYYPRLAGKPALYLYRQLLNFASGRRNNPMMEHMVAGLSDDYLQEIAAHFAALDPPHQAHLLRTWPQAVLARGERLVRRGDAERKVPACEACHGERLTGVEPATPALLGLPADYISAQLGAWRAGTRAAPEPDCMAYVADHLSKDDIHAIAAWLASQPLPDEAAAAAAGSVNPPLECGSLAP